MAKDTELVEEINGPVYDKMHALRDHIERCRDTAQNPTTREQLDNAMEELQMVKFHLDRASASA